MRAYLLMGAAGAVFAGLVGAYFVGKSDGKAAIMARLKDERIEILLDGKKVDDEVLTADDGALCDLLGGCSVLD